MNLRKNHQLQKIHLTNKFLEWDKPINSAEISKDDENRNGEIFHPHLRWETVQMLIPLHVITPLAPPRGIGYNPSRRFYKA